MDIYYKYNIEPRVGGDNTFLFKYLYWYYFSSVIINYTLKYQTILLCEYSAQ